MSFTPIATRSIPTVSCRPARKATRSFVPTPSVDDTSTGAREPAGILTKLAKPPTPPSTSARFVAWASGVIRRTAASPASMSTPDSRYVSGFTSGVEEAELRRRLGLDADAIAAGEAGVTEMPWIRAGRLQHPIEREVTDRIGAEIAPDVLGAGTRP